ncbi:unnamed protein product [Darwinula stevensoni]|uniref:Cadherin domain-containing protein n=1 Tax=Darwinula stevensoni TaxID=69355 RepID=A0A7R8ZXV9_9CRUS|nr:unnamed protein product [Darwinula stevensoni]CAG0879180.1 unnamed protein product [Darwinula stevensoni]
MSLDLQNFLFDKQQDSSVPFELRIFEEPGSNPPRNVAVLNVIRELNFETQTSHRLTIIVQDLQDEYGNGPHSESATITVEVEDIQDTPPRFFYFDSFVDIEEDYGSNTTGLARWGDNHNHHNSRALRIKVLDSLERRLVGLALSAVDGLAYDPEWHSIDEVVANFLASDGDTTPEIARNIIYSISGGNGEGYFKIDQPTDGSDTAKLRRAKTVDSEAPNTTFITLNITATELFENDTETDQSTSQTCVVSVADIDDNDPMFNFDHFTSEVDEDISYGVPLSFKSPGGEETFINVTDADAIAVEDVNGIAKNTATVTVKVNPKNDNFPQWSDPPYDGDPVVNENAPSGTEILTLKATDADRENGDNLWYYLSDRSFTGKELFSVDLETGELSVADGANVDWETFGTNLIIYVVASDEADDPLVSHRNETSFDITILDVNDNPPQFSNIEEIFGSENTNAGETLVGSVRVSDLDQPGTSNTDLEPEIVRIECMLDCAIPGDATGLVELMMEQTSDIIITYIIRFNADMDFAERRGQYEVEVTVSDKGDPMLSTTEIIILHIVDRNDEYFAWSVEHGYIFPVEEVMIASLRGSLNKIRNAKMLNDSFVLQRFQVGSDIINSNTGAEFYKKTKEDRI